MQYLALFVPPGAQPFDRSVLGAPGIAHYHARFGTQPGDVGRIAVVGDDVPIGAAWSRFVHGYGYIDDDTPELGIAVVPERRGMGVGADLLRSLMAAEDRLGLCVDRRNPAFRLYERLGFRAVREDGDGVIMLWTR